MWPCFIRMRITSTALLRHAVREFLDGDGLQNRSLRGTSLSFGSVGVLTLEALDAAAERRVRTLTDLVGAECRDQREAATALLGDQAASAVRAEPDGRRRRQDPGEPCAGLPLPRPRSPAAGSHRHRPRLRLVLAEAFLGEIVGLALGFFVVLAAVLLFALARLGRLAFDLLAVVALVADRRALPRRSCALRPRARGASASAWRARLLLLLGQGAQDDARTASGPIAGMWPRRGAAGVMLGAAGAVLPAGSRLAAAPSGAAAAGVPPTRRFCPSRPPPPWCGHG